MATDVVVAVKTDDGGPGDISGNVIFTAAVILTILLILIVVIGLWGPHRRPVTGVEGLVGEAGEALEPLDPRGMVRVHGELWQAESVAGPIGKDEDIRVTAIKRLRLYVEPLNNDKKPPHERI
ncbi:hypothetical protein GCM10023143_04420 [Compostibacter hankyongensis]|uniref:NfeD-like C-terminal domain-containing protein n=2 Tax=Compostibacter hankyongensis TaxID=1007089 RepID=A0ABP8FFA3_9BACT